MTLALVPGSFDPVTSGHFDVIQRASRLFSQVTVLVVRNSQKSPLFTIDERIEMLTELCKHLTGVKVDSFDGLLIRYASEHGAEVIVKGLRFVSDFEYEMQMALANQRLDRHIETIFLPATVEHSDLSSSIVKEIARLGGSVEGIVPKLVAEKLYAKYGRTQG